MGDEWRGPGSGFPRAVLVCACGPGTMNINIASFHYQKYPGLNDKLQDHTRDAVNVSGSNKQKNGVGWAGTCRPLECLWFLLRVLSREVT